MTVRELIRLLEGVAADDAEVGVFLWDRTLAVTHGEAVHIGRLDPQRDWGPGAGPAPSFTVVIHAGNVHPGLRPKGPTPP